MNKSKYFFVRCCSFGLVAVAVVLAILCGTLLMPINGFATLSGNSTRLCSAGEFDWSADNDYDVTSCNGTADFISEEVYVCGTPIGIAVKTDGLIVLGTGFVSTSDGEASPMEGRDIKSGDVLLKVNGEVVSTVFQLKQIMSSYLKSSTSSEFAPMKLDFCRGGTKFCLDVTPALDKYSLQLKLGLCLKEDVGGIGTLTYVTKDNRFGGLGHGITDAESGLSEQLDQGHIYPVSIDSVTKGLENHPGGLNATFNRFDTPLGSIDTNSSLGIFGNYSGVATGFSKVKTAVRGEAKIGKAQILTTVEGTAPKLYDIEVVKVVTQENAASKGFVLAVTDKELIAKTGGIVQGMSGSPILQDNKLIGAVTHVFVSDPRHGYGVQIRFMLSKCRENQIHIEENAA